MVKKKRAGVAILIIGKVDFKMKLVKGKMKVII